MNPIQEELNEDVKYRKTRRRYYDLHRDEIVKKCSDITKERYKNDAEYREKVKQRSRERYIAKKNKVEVNEKRDQIKDMLIELDSIKSNHRETIAKLNEEYRIKIEELNNKIDKLREEL